MKSILMLNYTPSMAQTGNPLRNRPWALSNLLALFQLKTDRLVQLLGAREHTPLCHGVSSHIFFSPQETSGRTRFSVVEKSNVILSFTNKNTQIDGLYICN
ncbi:hypothetical protein AVEN_218156-1 [Araneus ventricosus]|uniref:Uncharacterized protein n=1 Tax=Araneus ventricosus TaxID=182803 RepID=A0A4Y2FUE4_ARAVE|nr:hypothetical protein AVEN_218156-1 [Araneus ventricosus]